MDNKPFIEAYQEINSRFIKLLGSMSALRELSNFEVKHTNEAMLIDASLKVLLEYHDLNSVTVYMYEDEVLKQVAARDWNSTDESAVFSTRIPGAAQRELVAKVESTGNVQQLNWTLGEEDAESFACAVPIHANDSLLGVFFASHPHNDFFSVNHERNLLIYCNFLGQLIMNNRLLHSMDEMVRERTQQLQDALEEARTLKKRYEELSVIDDLTKLYNRRFFFPEADTCLARALRYNQPLSLLMLDIDRFKQINDKYGHAEGDKVLRELAKILKEEARQADVLARFGGEEFVLALPETGHEGAMVLAERIRKHIKEHHWQIADQSLTVTVCIGAAGLEETDSRDCEVLLNKLLQQADAALYHGKVNGRDQSNYYGDIASAAFPAE